MSVKITKNDVGVRAGYDVDFRLRCEGRLARPDFVRRAS